MIVTVLHQTKLYASLITTTTTWPVTGGNIALNSLSLYWSFTATIQFCQTVSVALFVSICCLTLVGCSHFNKPES